MNGAASQGSTGAGDVVAATGLDDLEGVNNIEEVDDDDKSVSTSSD